MKRKRTRQLIRCELCKEYHPTGPVEVSCQHFYFPAVQCDKMLWRQILPPAPSDTGTVSTVNCLQCRLIIPESYLARHHETRRHNVNLAHFGKTSYYECESDTHSRIIERGRKIKNPMKSFVCVFCTELLADVSSLRSHQANTCRHNPNNLKPR